MNHAYWNDWYLGWGWFLWFGAWFLLISSVGHWGYSYRTAVARRPNPARRHSTFSMSAMHAARSTVKNEEFGRMKLEIAAK